MKNPARPPRQAIEAMLASIRHRGPDGTGVEMLGECALGNVRLAIVDLSDRGRQPMVNAAGNVWITYNGECYNAPKWRRFFETRGLPFRSATDTEVVLRLYEEFGDDFLPKLRGMFALAIWDSRSKRLLLARDRLGIKPLFMSVIPEGLVFASELRAFLASGLVPPRLNPQGASAFLQLGHIPPPWTALNGVEPLSPGEYAVWRDGSLERREYWDVDAAPAVGADGSSRATLECLHGTLLEAARLHRMSDVPVALFLSGGADSAAVGALMRSAGANDLTALTVGFAEQGFDESAESSQTAACLGLPHRVLRYSANDMAGSLDHALWAMDQPTMDGLNVSWISKAAADAGFKVAISGQGGDEFFGGYESVHWFKRLILLSRILRPLPVGAGSLLFDHRSFPMRWRKLANLAGADDSFVAAQLAVRLLFPPDDVTRLLSREVGQGKPHSEAREHLLACMRRLNNPGDLEKIASLDIHAHLQPRLLRDGDAMSMAHSLEVRPLLLDHAVVEHAMSFPAAARLNRKKLLLDALRGVLPEELRRDLAGRPKRTFTFPFAKWLTGAWRPALEAAFQPERVRKVGVLQADSVSEIWCEYLRHPARIGWPRAWTLFVLQRWCEIMSVRP